MKTFLFVMVVLGVTSAQANSRLESSVESLYSTVKNMASAELTCSEVSDCRAMEVGSRACGGPNDYVVYSLKNPVASELNAVGEALKSVEDKYNMEAGMFSICSIESAPQVACVENKCVAK